MSRRFTILLEHHRKSNRAGIAGWSNACAVFLLCVATSVPSSAQAFTTLANFDYANGGQPYLTSLIQGIDGNFYGTTPVGGAQGPYGTIFNITPAGTLTTFHSFDGSDGAFATAGLVQAANGTFYGTTETGGAKYSGTVFKITPDGTLTTLHSFCALTNCVDGQQPDAASPLKYFAIRCDYSLKMPSRQDERFFTSRSHACLIVNAVADLLF